MTIEILVPDLPESVADATVATWHKQPGDAVERDEVLVDIETDKVVLEVPAPEAGVLEAIIEEEGATVLSKQLIAKLKPGAVAGEPTKDTTEESEASPDKRHKASLTEESNDALSPAVRRLLGEHGLEASQVKGTGVGGRITREDIEAHLANAKEAPKAEAPAAVEAPAAARSQKRVPMTRLRKTVANRLLEAKNNTAMLTTFNEVNMKPIMDLRKQYKDQFEERHGIRLGFMSFFAKAATMALQNMPQVNAMIDGTDMVYNDFYDIGIAVSTPKGLIVPVIRNTDQLGFHEVESAIRDFALRGRDGKVTIDEMSGGTFTITNGGTFGSM